MPASPVVNYNTEFLCELLIRQRLLTEQQRKEVFTHEAQMRAKIMRARQGTSRGRRSAAPMINISPVEIIAAFNFPMPDNPNRTITEDRIMEAIAREERIPYQKLDSLRLDNKAVTGALSGKFCRRHTLIPVAVTDQELTLAVSNPFDTAALEEVRRSSGKAIRYILSSPTDINRIINDFFGFQRSVKGAELRMKEGPDLGNLEQYIKIKGVEEIDPTEKPIVSLVEYMFHFAFDQGASDIHIEPKREHSELRMRIDGILHTVNKFNRVIHPAVVGRIKTMARLDIAEKRKPQDGRIKVARGDREVELRISTLPVAFGEKVVIRVFDPEILIQDFDKLGFFPREREIYETWLNQPNGLILVTGPTGSGKTTTLYSSLRLVATPDVNVTTIEDPIEMVCEEFNQTAVNPKIGLTFSAALRNILRQDPDIIMVGEVRDPETAENAVQSALTGHLVLATLHTNDTPSAISRMTELGVKPFLLASVLRGVMAQRLVRRICMECITDGVLTEEQITSLDIQIPEGMPRELPVKFGEGCPECRFTGYRGRTAIVEVMPISHKVRKMINDNIDAKEIMKVARADGMMTLRECAIKKLAHGVTTFEEVFRVTADS
ncbi:MAG: Type II secretion system protein E [Myxococcota bacterium]|nr:Type II secretion system protein E [Myxococcota bacterium]